jgi:GTP1/Obg family GTP-binding protein
VVGKSYHRRAKNTMAKRKIRAIYRQFFGSIADIITSH